MFGLATRVRAATAVAGVVGLALLLPNANESPASGEFDGRLFANPETGCPELPPEGWDAAQIMPVAPMPSPRADDGIRDGTRRRLEELRGPVWQSGAHVHAEPWPACDKPGALRPRGTTTGVDR